MNRFNIHFTCHNLLIFIPRMRSRSTRLFIVLLHLLGVPNHYNQNSSGYYNWTTKGASGILGVHPYSIVLETLDLQEVGGLDGVEWFRKLPPPPLPPSSPLQKETQQQEIQNKQQQQSDTIEQKQQVQQSKPYNENQRIKQQQRLEPFWLQDSADEKCLGPSGGFSECGDATLWFIERKERKRSTFNMYSFGVEEGSIDEDEPYRYAIQIVDMDYEKGLQQQSQFNGTTEKTNNKSERLSWLFNRSRGRHILDQKQFTSAQNCLIPSKRKKNKSSAGLISLEPCTARRGMWSWRVDQNGRLYEITKNSENRRCLWRMNNGETLLSDCDEGLLDEESLEPGRLVQFALVRYRATITTDLCLHDECTTNVDINARKDIHSKPLHRQEEVEKVIVPPKEMEPAASNEEKNKKETDALESRNHLPKTNVDIAHSHASAPASHLTLKLGSRISKDKGRGTNEKDVQKFSKFETLKNTNPILFISRTDPEDEIGSSDNDGIILSKKVTPSIDASYKLRRIAIHPYIAASKDEIWIDKKTGLEFHTDLCKYLGHNRKEYGRHTLTGVGQFTKTIMKIKVYGVALYVSKRDVLADPGFEKYAGLTAEELRQKPDFYKHLRNDYTLTPIDRTVFLKINMQLGTDTMRSSLDSDWKLLDDEAKKLLIDSSMRPRPANERMLERIQSPDNPSRCSCAQIAPESYNADPSCCARGTELVFTWRKNGDLEVRLDGRLMDSFPRPEIAKGIFYEYLRTDDPMSFDYLDRAVDGFPFLLGPLERVKDVGTHLTPKRQNMGSTGASASASNNKDTNSNSFAFGTNLKQHWTSFTDNVGGVAGALGDNARNLGGDIEHKREQLWKGILSLPQNMVSQRERYALIILGDEKADEKSKVVRKNRAPRGRAFKYPFSRWLGEDYQASDEIGPMHLPPTGNTTRKVFVALVHLYLLLLLIVSFPGSYQTRSKLVYRRYNSDKSPSRPFISNLGDSSDSDEGTEHSLLSFSDEDSDDLFDPSDTNKHLLISNDTICREFLSSRGDVRKRRKIIVNSNKNILHQEQETNL